MGKTLGRTAVAACLGLSAAACDNPEGGRAASGQVGLGSATTPSEDTASEVFECPKLEVPEDLAYFPDYIYSSPLNEQFGDEVLRDVFTVEIIGGEVGSYQLGEGDNQSYATCQQCVLIGIDDGTKWFFQESGRLEIDPGSRPDKGELESDLVSVRLVEVTIDPETFATEVVKGGECFEIVDLEVNSLKIKDWDCASGFYGSEDGCDCGCGVTDPDCKNDSINSCEFCDAPGSCSEFGGACPGAIHSNNNAICDVSAAWSCDLAIYDAGDGRCDCGCGLVDPDCGRPEASACDTCTQPGSCAAADTTSCVGAINAVSSGACSPVLGWTCNPTYYAANDGCDCGCGVKDPDCSGGDVEACEWCGEVGSCAEGEPDCANIDSKDTASCQ